MSAFTASDLEARTARIRNRRAAVGLAVAMIRSGSPDLFTCSGLADIGSRTPVTEDTVFRIESITKTLTAVAVMQLWEQGLVDLDAAANAYLRAFTLVPADPGWRPATVRHLLTHTAGLPELARPWQAIRSGWFSETVPPGGPVPTLAESYRGRLRLAAEPGTTFTYTNHTFATLGQIVEDVTGERLDRYVAEHIFAPLGMTDSDLAPNPRLEHDAPPATSSAPPVRGRWSSARASRRQPVTSAPPRGTWRGTRPRSSTAGKASTAPSSSPRRWRPCSPRTTSRTRGVPGFGLGFYRADLGGHAAVDHPGIINAFNAHLLVAPDDGAAVVALTNGTRNGVIWLQAEAATLLGGVIGAPEDRIRTDVPQHPESWGELCGWYRPVAQRGDMQARGIAGAGVQVEVRRGRLVARALTPLPGLLRGFVLHPDDPDDPEVFPDRPVRLRPGHRQGRLQPQRGADADPHRRRATRPGEARLT